VAEYVSKGVRTLATEEPKPEETEIFYKALRSATEIYAHQHFLEKNGLEAAKKALDDLDIRDGDPRRRTLISHICSKLGKAGGNAAFVSKNQLELFPTK
jgi:hypothetical protein